MRIVVYSLTLLLSVGASRVPLAERRPLKRENDEVEGEREEPENARIRLPANLKRNSIEEELGMSKKAKSIDGFTAEYVLLQALLREPRKAVDQIRIEMEAFGVDISPNARAQTSGSFAPYARLRKARAKRARHRRSAPAFLV